MTIVKLLDGTKLYMHAVADNLSRRILTRMVALRLGFRLVVPYPRCKKVSEDWVHSMMGVHQIPNTSSAAEKVPSMIW